MVREPVAVFHGHDKLSRPRQQRQNRVTQCDIIDRTEVFFDLPISDFQRSIAVSHCHDTYYVRKSHSRIEY